MKGCPLASLPTLFSADNAAAKPTIAYGTSFLETVGRMAGVAVRANPDEAAEVLNKHVFNGKQIELAKQVIPQMIKIYFDNTTPGFKVPRATFDALIKGGVALNSFPSGKVIR